ncbi:DUF6538 domain-containing protein [Loktanella sp. SALINAS62]|uniref:DUF6538 domain-containing protein n=1 Tax=Loktanella sp. SALINAS62 TaxID=2706124 RepID=UPI0032C474BB
MSEIFFSSFAFVKGGTFYVSRSFPKKLRGHYTSPWIASSLRTTWATCWELR